jgi:hypothetical protein
MGQFKPMVKMTTTEPSVELKLKSGGKVEKKMQMGGALAATPAAGPAMRAPARGGMMPAAAPGKPSMADRRRAMKAGPTGAAPAGPMGMAGRMMKDGGEATSLKAHAGMPASKAHKGLKTGGVVDGQGGYKSGGIIKSTTGKTKVDTAKPDRSPAKTGAVKRGNAGGYAAGGAALPKPQVERGMPQNEIPSRDMSQPEIPSRGMPQPEVPPKRNAGTMFGPAPVPRGRVQRGISRIQREYATGGVAKANAGGYKKGGAAKKAYATGGLVDSGRPVAMPQGAKKPSTPVSINQLSGTFKKGGAVMMKEGGKADVPPKGVEDTIQTARNERDYKAWEKSQAEENKAAAQGAGSMFSSIPRKLKEIFSPAKAASAPGSVTKTEKSVTVTPKKRGGAVTC